MVVWQLVVQHKLHLAAKNDITIPSGGIQDDFIYLTHGGTTAGTYNAGKFLIRFYGAKVTGL